MWHCIPCWMLPQSRKVRTTAIRVVQRTSCSQYLPDHLGVIDGCAKDHSDATFYEVHDARLSLRTGSQTPVFLRQNSQLSLRLSHPAMCRHSAPGGSPPVSCLPFPLRPRAYTCTHMYTRARYAVYLSLI